MTTETITVPEIHCQHCVASIEGALGDLEGVREAAVDVEDTKVTVTYDDARVDHDALVGAIEAQGYSVPA